MTHQRTALSFFNLGIQRSTRANGVEEILNVILFTTATAPLRNFFSFWIQDAVAGIDDVHRPFGPVEIDNTVFFIAAGQATADFPRAAFVAEMKDGDTGIRGFLVVVEMVSTAEEADLRGIVDTQSPAGDVQRVDAVVGEFTAAPMPSPVPVVMHKIVDIGAFRGRALPCGIVQVIGYWNLFPFAD